MAYAQYFDHRNRHVDSLEQVLAVNPPTGAELAIVYRDLMWGYKQINTEKSMEYARKCIATSIPLNGWRTVADGYNILGLNFYKISQYDSAMVYFEKALEATEWMKHFPERYAEYDIDDNFSSIYGGIGNLYNIQGKCHEAIEYYTKALKIFEKYDWKQSQANANYNIGEMYLSMENYEQAEINFLKSDSLAHITNDSLIIAAAKYHLSCLYVNTKEYSKALQNAEIARGYYFSHPEEDAAKAETLHLLSEIWLEGYGDLERAETYVYQALEILDALDIPRETAVSLRILSSIHLKHNEWRKAEQTALKALATDNSEPANTLALYDNLAIVYAKLGMSNKVYEYFDKHKALQSSWSNKNYQSAIREMEVKYETEKKETQIATLETENRLLTAEKRLMLWLGVAALLLALAALFLTIQKRRLAEQKIKQFEQEKQLIATQSVLDGEIQERIRLARDLHDGLGSYIAGTRLHLLEIKKESGQSKQAGETGINTALNLLDESMREMRRISHHLMPETLTTLGLKQSAADFCSTIPHATFNYYGNEKRIAPKMEMMLYRIMHELVTNALKHSGAGHILVEIMHHDRSVSLTVQDDGCGFDPSIPPKGMGLANIRTRVAAFNGTLIVDTKPGSGTEVHVKLNIND